MSVCLDSWDVLAFIDGEEPAADAAQAAFEAGRPLRWLNIGEATCRLERRHGAAEAARVIVRLRTAVALDDVTPDRVLDAAHIKAAHPTAFADCFAAATESPATRPSSLTTPSCWTVTSDARRATSGPVPLRKFCLGLPAGGVQRWVLETPGAGSPSFSRAVVVSVERWSEVEQALAGGGEGPTSLSARPPGSPPL